MRFRNTDEALDALINILLVAVIGTLGAVLWEMAIPPRFWVAG